MTKMTAKYTLHYKPSTEILRTPNFSIFPNEIQGLSGNWKWKKIFRNLCKPCQCNMGPFWHLTGIPVNGPTLPI